MTLLPNCVTADVATQLLLCVLLLTKSFDTQLLVTSGLPDDKATLVARVYKKNTGALSRALAGRTLTVNQLTDMQWRFGVTSGSSEVRKSGKTFLQMKLTINNGVKNEDVFMGDSALPLAHDHSSSDNHGHVHAHHTRFTTSCARYPTQ